MVGPANLVSRHETGFIRVDIRPGSISSLHLNHSTLVAMRHHLNLDIL